MTQAIRERDEFMALPPDDQKYVAELRKFFELVIREIFLAIVRYGEKNLDREYIRKAMANTQRDERFIVAEFLSIMQGVAKRDFAALPGPPAIYTNREVREIVRAEAENLVTAYRKIGSIREGR